jgi:hypothetical protein
MTICVTCSEGKCGACIGSAFVEADNEIEEVECQCRGEHEHEESD